MTSTDDLDALKPRTDEGCASWRQLNSNLWVGHEGPVSLGTIEHGARYVFIDADGTAHPGVGSLRDAQQIATGPIRLPVQPLPEPAPPRLGQRLLVPGVVLLGFLLVLAASWLVASALLIA